MLEIITPAQNRQLTTLEALGKELGLPEQEWDEAMLAAIDRASAAISAYCGRTFARETVRETWVHRVTPRELILTRYPIASITGLTVAGETVDMADLTFNPEAGIVYGHRLGTAGARTQLTYVAGYALPGEQNANLPPEIEQAALQAAKTLWLAKDRDPLMKSEQIEGIGRTDYWVGPVDGVASYLSDVLFLLSSHRSVEVG
jgi:hypothetical protein